MCGIPPSTLRSWLAGTKTGADADALIVGPEGADGRLSFQNLVEAYVIRLMQTQGGVSTRRLRNTVLSERERGIARPFLNPEAYRVGSGVYVEDDEDLVDASEWRQYVLQPLIEQYISRIEFEDGRPVELFPAYPGEDNRAVKLDPRIRFGRPAIKGTGIRTLTIWGRVKSGEKIQDIAEGYGIDPDLAVGAYRYEVSRRGV